jgi:hypothetical protein
MHKELSPYRTKFRSPGCTCKHTEWFQISEEVAKQTLRRWIIFMKSHPYDEQGGLKAFWRDRLVERPRTNHYRQRESACLRVVRMRWQLTSFGLNFALLILSLYTQSGVFIWGGGPFSGLVVFCVLYHGFTD